MATVTKRAVSVDRLECGDVLLAHDNRWSIISIDEERLGRELHLRDFNGIQKSEFFCLLDVVTIEA